MYTPCVFFRLSVGFGSSPSSCCGHRRCESRCRNTCCSAPVSSGRESRSGPAGPCCSYAFALLGNHRSVSHGDTLSLAAPSACLLGPQPRGVAPQLVRGQAFGLPCLCLRPGISQLYQVAACRWVEPRDLLRWKPSAALRLPLGPSAPAPDVFVVRIRLLATLRFVFHDSWHISGVGQWEVECSK